MAQTVKSSLRMSMAMRYLGTSTKLTLGKELSPMSTCGFPNHMRAPVFLYSKTLWRSLETSRTATQLLGIIEENKRIMTTTHVFIALKKLMDILYYSADELEGIYEDPRFLTLCNILTNYPQYLDGENCVVALRAMISCKVPVTSVVVKMILQVAHKNLDFMSLDNLRCLYDMLVRCNNTPLVIELKIAVSRVYETNLSTKLDRESISEIRSALSYLSTKSSHAETFNFLIDAAMSCKQPIDPGNAVHILDSFCDLKCYPHQLPEALNHVQNVLAKNIDQIEPFFILKLVKKICEKVMEQEYYYYRESFIDECASAAISQNWDLDMASSLLNQLNLITHTHPPLLNYIMEKLLENRMFLEAYSPLIIFNLVNSYAIAEYKPIVFSFLQELVTSEKILKCIDNNGMALTKLSLNLLTLGVYCPELLKKNFEHYSKLVTRSNFDSARILVLYQVVKTLYPQYTGPWPCNDILELGLRHCNVYFPLLASLEAAIGGSTYVITNIRTKLGHVIDHAIVMRKGGFPVAINTDNLRSDESLFVQLEDIKPPADSQVFLILYLSQYAYSINTHKLMGPRSLQVKSLEALTGYTVVPIRSTAWMSLSESQKIPYLMQTIRLKYDKCFGSVSL